MLFWGQIRPTVESDFCLLIYTETVIQRSSLPVSKKMFIKIYGIMLDDDTITIHELKSSDLKEPFLYNAHTKMCLDTNNCFEHL